MAEVGLQEVETYIARLQNTVEKYITTRTIMDLCLAEEQRPGTRVYNRWWDQEGLYLEGMRMESQEVGREESKNGADGEADGADTETEYHVGGYYSNHNILGMEHNATLSYAPGSEIHHLTISMLGVNRGRLERDG